MKIKKICWIGIGCIAVGLGAIGTVLPILPSFPFLLLAAVSFAKSSEKLHTWFIHTNLYKNNLESYVKGQGMTWNVKMKILSMVTFLMFIGIMTMLLKAVYVPCIILGFVWIVHIVYFVFGVKTIRE